MLLADAARALPPGTMPGPGEGVVSASAPALRNPTTPDQERSPRTQWRVNSTDDEAGECTSGYCTLRAALSAASANPGPDLIVFDIPLDDPGYDPVSGQWTIAPATPLPVLSDDGTALDATTQPAPPRAAARPLLGVGNCPQALLILNASALSYGFEVTAADVEITGFAIHSALVHGVYIHGTGARDTLISCNEITSSADDGLHISAGATGSRIGSDQEYGNLFSYNGGDGIEITGGASEHTITGNLIGTTGDGTSAWANAGYGVRIRGAISNTVGLTSSGGGNLISSNIQGGVLIDGGTGSARHNLVMNNTIGTNAAQSAVLPNKDGVYLLNASNCFVEGNLIAGNTRDGVTIDGNLATDNMVANNIIGQDPNGPMQRGNQRWGVLLQNESSKNNLTGNTIRKNGFEGEYTRQGGVGILTASTNNELRLNEIAANAGDGVYIHSADRNTLDRNSIYNNTLLGINNEAGGNQELHPPVIQSYSVNSSNDTVVTATACPGCTVQVFSDNAGEGKNYENQYTADATTGAVSWTGTPKGLAYTATATDSLGNTSEFSAAPVFLDLSIDDALPHVVVNKVPGDATAPAGKTIVEFVANITSYDGSLTQNLDLEIQIPSNALGSPTRVFYRDTLSSLNGTAITTWTNPSSGRYRVSGINLLADSSGAKWTRRIVFRFGIPHNATPFDYGVFAYLDATARQVSRSVDWALLRLLKQAEGIVITNRTLMYNNKYRNYDDQWVTPLLQGIYSMAQGSPYNNSPLLVVYRVDLYSATARTWDNTSVNYSLGETAVNAAANAINALLEDWKEDSASVWVSSGGCNTPLDYPPWIVIVGDDDVVPLYRRPDPTSDEDDDVTSSDPVVKALQAADYMFTDNPYADFAAKNCDCPWDQGCVDHYIGRLVGGRAVDMLHFLNSGLSGPATSLTDQAIVASFDGFNAERIAEYLVGRGFDVKNDSEAPETINDGDWTLADLLALMSDTDGYAAFAHQGHANPVEWETADAQALTASDINDGTRPSIIGAHHPFVTSCGCRSGLALGKTWTSSVVYGWIRAGASGVVGSTALMKYHPFYTSPGVTYDMLGEKLMRNFWYFLVKASPGQVSSGLALALAKRHFDYGISVSSDEELMSMANTLYGLPWVGIYGTISSSPRGRPLPDLSLDGADRPGVSPAAVLSDTYVVSYTLDASVYEIMDVEGFDLVRVEGMDLSWGDEGPVVPLAKIELPLPLGAAIEGITVVREAPAGLGALDIPLFTPRLPIPGGDPGGYSPTPDSVGLYPSQPHSVSVTAEGTSQLARIHVIPLDYDAVTDQTTLYQDVTVGVTYQLSTPVGLLSLAADPASLAPEEPFAVHATLVNATDTPALMTGTLTLEDGLGAVVAATDVTPFEVPPGEEFAWEGSWTAPGAEGSYSLWLELWHGGQQQIAGRQMLGVAAGRITALTVPDRIQPGQQAAFQVTFANLRGEPYNGQVNLAIYSATGTQVALLEAPLSAARGEGTADLFWDTTGAALGPYTAVARVVGAAEGITYGAMPQVFDLKALLYLPLIQRQGAAGAPDAGPPRNGP
jgi:CSLREA domain-containing protein